MKFTIAAVPEHFTIPLHQGVENGLFDKYLGNKHSVQIDEYPKGTGSMCKALKQKHCDIAIALTEGLVLDRMKNKSDFRIVGAYVDSPLQWATVVRHDRKDLHSLKDLKGSKVGISRFGSGSHIMSFVLAQNQQFEGQDMTYVPCGGMEDLLQSVENQKVDSFMWETFMVRDAVQSNRVKYLGYTTTPWPCFMIAVRKNILDQYPEEIQNILKGIQETCHSFSKKKQESIHIVSKKCKLNQMEAKEWFEMTRFSKDSSVSGSMIETVVETLIQTGALADDVSRDTPVLSNLAKVVE